MNEWIINNKWIAFKSIWYDFMYSLIFQYRHTYTRQILMPLYGTNHEHHRQLKKLGSEKLVSVPQTLNPALEMWKCQFFPQNQEGLVSGFSIIPNWFVHFYAEYSIFLLKVEFVDNVLLVSYIQQSGSVIYFSFPL